MKYLPCGFILCVCNVNPCNKDLWFTVNFHRTWQPREPTEILTSLSEKRWGTEQRFASEQLGSYFRISWCCDYCKLQGFEGVRTCLPSESLQTIVRRIVTTKVQYRTAGKLSREKTFAWLFATVFSAKFGGVVFFGGTVEQSAIVFPAKMVFFSPLCESFLPQEFPLYSRCYM